ncbi:MAG: hypothetical protein HeimC3_33880 [Candidatus Heimdallarchaeota archaeon LC_3]|nr:MAG: hypothetical protein HeimC3_33880 [Candidatus Heimdallarchaeota archaeon LC_3]
MMMIILFGITITIIVGSYFTINNQSAVHLQGRSKALNSQFCTFCGDLLENDSKFCSNCGPKCKNDMIN